MVKKKIGTCPVTTLTLLLIALSCNMLTCHIVNAFAPTTTRRFVGQLLGRQQKNKRRCLVNCFCTTTRSSNSSRNDDKEYYLNEKNQRDQVISAISSNGEIKVTAATARNLVNDFMLMHNLTPVPADALGRALICALLLSNGMQDDQTFQLTIQADGPLRGAVAISNGLGQVRGYVGAPSIGSMPLSEAVGQGTIQVVKTHPEWTNPYNGITSIRHGDIDRDVGIYLAESEQRSCALAAATSFNGILCTSAGGYVVEKLPGCSPHTIAMVERNLAKLVQQDGTKEQVPTGLLISGITPLDICSLALTGLEMKPLQQLEPKVVCECNEERVIRAIRLLGKDEVQDILVNEGKIEARCQFCGRVYRMGPDEVEKHFSEARGNPALDLDF